MATMSLVLVTSGTGGGTSTVLNVFAEIKKSGSPVDLCLLQDAVLCALEGNETDAGEAIARALEQDLGVYYLEDDLIARGFRREDVRSGARPVGHGELVEMMLSDGRTVLGAF